ncbi:hypothetical protein [Clostridium felsineum]|uniref:Uncharacterized protein n=1 Tax=Clostridium felsineum TaxID=36839 RepID=A0A1S8KZE4_9CLOT|nr:hypothetical protein [Clostridium felsineum]URZ07667.1 hypothetical protein CLROS_030280 [Clostridium felsineum]URZ12698.1 hypothetical protein CROST_034430 [Clostridium felsineum]
MNYIGPFFRLNSLNKNSIKNQLLHLSKESIRDILFNSECGIKMPFKNLKTKQSSLNDINTFKSLSPLVSLYSKSSCKLYTSNNKLKWKNSNIKKDILVSSNAYMTLSLLDLCSYYKNLKDVNQKKFNISNLYLVIIKNQLDFYNSYLRNFEGVFVDKTDVSSDLISEIKLENKDENFKFSNQAFLMCAYYKYSVISNEKFSKEYQNFSLDILNMFINFRNDLYSLSFSELNKLTLALNIFYSYSKNEKSYELLLDIFEYLSENYGYIDSNDNIENSSLLCLNSVLLYNNSNMFKFKDYALKIHSSLSDLYNPALGIFIKDTEKKEVKFSCNEIVLYILNSMLVSELCEDKSIHENILVNVFKHQLIESGIIQSWPEAPNIQDCERYKNFSLKSEDLLEETYFKMPTISSPKNTEIASVFFKKITYNKKKKTFSISKKSFYSDNNLFLFFIIIHLFKDYYNTQ